MTEESIPRILLDRVNFDDILKSRVIFKALLQQVGQ
jgi:hypothetical protein